MIHSHCPHDCEHPQPFVANPMVGPPDNKEFCGHCLVYDHELVEMIPCIPEICKDEHG
jgi:hypothetical protein